MLEEEIKQKFKETYPDYMYGDTPLSPYYDIFCYGIELIEQENEQLKTQIEKLLDFVVECTVCCDVCPSSDTCRNDEGTCPHAGLLKENEEKVTREWILKSITKE